MDRSLLIHRMDLEERTESTGEYMDSQYVWSKKRRNVRCRLQPIKAQEKIMAMREGVKITHKLFLEAAVPVNETNRWTKGSRIFHIKGVIDPDEMGRFLECTLEELE